MNTKVSGIFIGTLICLLPAVSQAEFRCQGKLPKGLNKLDVLLYCGEPVYRDSYTIPVFIEGEERTEYAGCETVDQWYYIDSVTSSTVQLDIEKGVVSRVEYGQVKPE